MGKYFFVSHACVKAVLPELTYGNVSIVQLRGTSVVNSGQVQMWPEGAWEIDGVGSFGRMGRYYDVASPGDFQVGDRIVFAPTTTTSSGVQVVVDGQLQPIAQAARDWCACSPSIPTLEPALWFTELTYTRQHVPTPSVTRGTYESVGTGVLSCLLT